MSRESLPPGHPLLVHAVVFLLAVAGVHAGSLRAQEVATPSPVASAQGPRAIPALEVAQQAEVTLSRLQGFEKDLGRKSEVEQVQGQLPAFTEQLRTLERDPRSQPAAAITLRDLGNIQRRWLRASEQLTEWTQLLTQRSLVVEARLAELRTLDESWSLTEKSAASEALPEALWERIRSLRGSIGDARDTLRQQRASILTLQATLAQHNSTVTGRLTMLESEGERLRRQLLRKDSAPFWSGAAELAEPGSWASSVREAWKENAADAAFLLENLWYLAVVALVFLALVVVAFRVRRLSATWPVDDPALEIVVQLRNRPVSAAALIVLLLARLSYPQAPTLVATSVAICVAIPVIRILQVGPFATFRSVPVSLAMLLIADAARELLPPFSAVARLVLVAESLAVGVWLWWLLQPSQLGRLPVPERWRQLIVLGVRAALVLCAVSAMANAVGNVSLALLLASGTLRSLFLAVVAYAISQVLDGTFIVFLSSWLGQSLRAVQRHGPWLRRRGIALIHAAMVVFWLTLTLSTFTAREPVIEVGKAVVRASVTVGSFHLSLGDVVALGLTIALSILLARLVRFVLEEDVLPRMSLPRGVPGAISVGASYTIVFLGFLAALSAAGLDFSRLTILLGAFGVGISFGLQTIVNNFVSGLILIFERPIQIGDTIEVEGLTGEVRRIGIRSSTIRTFDGSEVIVPNGNLLSEKVVNWTLSDRQRRIELKIGVAYGSDPKRVIGLLVEVARANADVLTYPPPVALFLGFGDSSLDFSLRAWTLRHDAFLQVRSDVGVAVYAALADAGIEIPFPQRDLHVRSIDESARRARSSREPGTAG